EYDSRCGLGWRPAPMARAYSLDLRERVVAAVSNGQSCRAGAGRVWGGGGGGVEWSQRLRADGSGAGKAVGGGGPYGPGGERDWLLARVGEAPDLTLRALAAELAGRGILVSHYAVWHLLIREGISFKKKPARQRAGTTRRGAAAGAMEEVSGQA